MDLGWMILGGGLALAAKALARTPFDDTKRYAAICERLRPSPEQAREYERRRRLARAKLIHEQARRRTRGGDGA